MQIVGKFFSAFIPFTKDTVAPLRVDAQGRLITSDSTQAYDVLNGASSTGDSVGPVQGGDYIWRVIGTFGGATAKLQFLDLDGVTWTTLTNSSGTAAQLTEAGQMGVGLPEGSVVRVELTGGAPSNIYSNIAGL